ncbi:MAG: 5-oxoprolinase subunit PxpB [Bacillota bacterium]|nr:5-oxoprolinase subunit PxpB [Bacillota bacterium]
MNMEPIEINFMGDSAIIIRLSNTVNLEVHLKIQAICNYFESNPFKGMIECVPSVVTVTVYYNPIEVLKNIKASDKGNPFQVVKNIVLDVLHNIRYEKEELSRIVEMPVCYGGVFGPDLDFVARFNKLSIEEVIEIHCNYDNRVYMIGFAPGFPYLYGMSERIAAPRKETPSISVPQGSVGIAGSQTGIYPISTPGGWQVIGRTPIRLFRPEDEVPSLIRSGDIIRFKRIDEKEYYKIKKLEEENEKCV